MINKLILRMKSLWYRIDQSSYFNHVYRLNLFAGSESVSGVGSDLYQTRIIRKELPKLFQTYHLRSILDAPCGQYHWFKQIPRKGIHYTGVDIVKDLIKRNKQFENRDTAFLVKNIIHDTLPKADIILCRDCLVHMSLKNAMKTIKNFQKSGSIYLLITTFSKRKFNYELGNTFWRPLNMKSSPFLFPRPILLINEHCTEGHNEYSDKSLGLWRLSSITMNI